MRHIKIKTKRCTACHHLIPIAEWDSHVQMEKEQAGAQVEAFGGY